MSNKTDRQAYMPLTQKELVHGLGRLPLPMPRTMRELFQLFALYDPAEGLSALLDRLDFAGVTPYQIYQVVHGRAPEELDLIARRDRYDPRAHLEAAVCSEEFQEQVLRRLLQAFPEKRRDVFIHVPKCAGTDLILNIGQRHLSLPKMIEVASWVTKAELFDALRHLAQAIPYYDTFFVYGHIPLGLYIDSVGIRAGDRVFSVIREPIEMMLSQANYAVTRLRQDPLGNDPDTREILELLGLKQLPDPASLAELKQLALRALLEPEIARPNQICFYLGGEEAARYETAVANLVRYDVEITTTRCYPRWLQARWGLASGSRHNASDRWLTADELDDEVFAALRKRTREDHKIFDVVSWILDKNGNPSSTGTQIAETVGSERLDEFAESLVSASCERSRRPELRPTDLKVVQGKAAIAAALETGSNVNSALRIEFGIEGNCRPHLGDGWAHPEPGFVWTCAPISRIEVPKPTSPGDYTLRVLGGPYVVKDRLPSQRLTITINGIILGTAVATERAIIDCPLPAAVLGGDDTADLAFTLPDAAKPSNITGADDNRILGFAVERIELFPGDTLGVGAAGGATRSGSETAVAPPAVGSTGSIAPIVDPAPIIPAPPLPSPLDRPDEQAVAVGSPAAMRSVLEADLSPRELMMSFESLGENCEFGLVQRRCGAEPLGLFRFASAPLPKLLAGLEAGFEGLSEPGNLDVQLSSNGREYMVHDKTFQLLYHAWVLADEMTAEEICRRESRRLPLLVRKLVEELRQATKIFVFHGMEPLSEQDAQSLLAHLLSYGPNTLLWVELAGDDHPAGTVAWHGRALLKGYIDRFAPGENAHDLSLDCWIAICREAYRLARIDDVCGSASSGLESDAAQ